MKKGIISGMVFMSILLVGCNGEEKGGQGVESEQEYPSLLAIPLFSPLHPRLLHAYPSLFPFYPSLFTLYPSLFPFYPSLSSLYPLLFAIPSFSPLHPRLLHAYPSLFTLYPSLFAILSLYPSLLMFRSLCLTISPQKNYNSVWLNCSSFLFHNPILSMFLYSVCF